MADPYRTETRIRKRTLWAEMADDYALAFFGCPCSELDPPEAEKCYRYADKHAGPSGFLPSVDEARHG